MMKTWKRIGIAVLAMILALAFSGITFADTRDLWVYDWAGLFDSEETKELSSRICDLRDEINMGVAVLTIDENQGTAQEFADDFYEEYQIGLGNDNSGVLLLIDLYNGELWISTEGDMIRYLTDDRIDAILDHVIESAYDEDFYGCVAGFLEKVEYYHDAGIEAGQYNYDTETGEVSKYRSIRWYEFLIAVVIAAIVAGGAVLAVIREYNMDDEAKRVSANFKLSYRKDSGFTLHDMLADVLLGSYVTRTVIRTQSNNRSGGGGSFAGRSSTHRSSSGRVHGGGGRSFRK